MVGPDYRRDWTVSASPEDLTLAHKFRHEKTYFLFGLIPIWHVSEEHHNFEARSQPEYSRHPCENDGCSFCNPA